MPSPNESRDSDVVMTPNKVQTVRYEIVGERPASMERGGIDFFTMFTSLINAKITIIAITAFITLAVTSYALLATEIYRARTVLAPADAMSAQSSLLAQFGGLANLAGLRVGGSVNSEAIAVLRSRDFAREFIGDFDLLPVFFADDWDQESSRWLIRDPEDWPDHRDGVKFFEETILTVRDDKVTGLVTLSVEWRDPNLAAMWANTLVDRLNSKMRSRAMNESSANIEYLRTELSNTNVVMLQQSIGRLLEVEMQKMMLAKGSDQFVYKVIDRAEIPKKRSWPKRSIIVVLAFMVGLIVSTVFVLVRAGWHRRIVQQD